MGSSTVIGFGWVLHFGVHIAAPTITLFFMGLTLTGAFNTVSTLLIDLYPMNAASATASNNFCSFFVGSRRDRVDQAHAEGDGTRLVLYIHRAGDDVDDALAVGHYALWPALERRKTEKARGEIGRIIIDLITTFVPYVIMNKSSLIAGSMASGEIDGFVVCKNRGKRVPFR
jgi:hypothetical protein